MYVEVQGRKMRNKAVFEDESRMPPLVPKQVYGVLVLSTRKMPARIIQSASTLYMCLPHLLCAVCMYMYLAVRIPNEPLPVPPP